MPSVDEAFVVLRILGEPEAAALPASWGIGVQPGCPAKRIGSKEPKTTVGRPDLLCRIAESLLRRREVRIKSFRGLILGPPGGAQNCVDLLDRVH